MGSFKINLQAGGSVQVYNFDKGRVGEGYGIPLYVHENRNGGEFTLTTLTPDEALALANELGVQAHAAIEADT